MKNSIDSRTVTLLSLRAKVEIERRRRQIIALPLLDFIPRVSRHLTSPYWFAPYAQELETAVGGGHKLVFAAPPQHGKTEVTVHALVWNLLRHPRRRFGYASYNSDRAISVARYFRQVAQQAGLELSGTLEHAYTRDGGGCLFAGRGTAVTGEPIDGFAIVDDPFKDMADASSACCREGADDWFRTVWTTRQHPGASSFVMATRWHEDDLSGRLIGRNWDFLNIPAIAEENDPLGRAVGEALSPHWPLAALLEKKEALGEFFWVALYQGSPRPKGGKVFNGVTYYDALPTSGYRVGIGIDLAYSTSTRADTSVIVVLYEHAGLFYVADVIRMQKEAPEFAAVLKQVLARFPGIRPRWHRSGTEKGVAQLMGPLGINVDEQVAIADKLVRATPAAIDWNAHRILVPRPAKDGSAQPWVDPFLTIIDGFTGLGDKHDDDVDALGSAHDVLTHPVPTVRRFVPGHVNA